MSNTAIPTPDPIKAKMFAEIAHAGQTYNDEVPYSHHVESVVSVLERFGYTDVEIRSAGFLHDTLEDTNRSYNDIKKRFGEGVAELVYAVTNELGRNRKERNDKTYPKIRGNDRATALKLADRIANVEYGIANGGKNDMYASEHANFVVAIRVETADERINRMWRHLGQLLQA